MAFFVLLTGASSHKRAEELRSSPDCRLPKADVWIRRTVMTLAPRLSRLCGIDIETCPACGEAIRIIACIEDVKVIEKSLARLDAKAPELEATRRPPSRATPQRGLSNEAGSIPRRPHLGCAVCGAAMAAAGLAPIRGCIRTGPDQCSRRHKHPGIPHPRGANMSLQSSPRVVTHEP